LVGEESSRELAEAYPWSNLVHPGHRDTLKEITHGRLLHSLGSSGRGFVEFDARVWDREIEADVKAGKLGVLEAAVYPEVPVEVDG